MTFFEYLKGMVEAGVSPDHAASIAERMAKPAPVGVPAKSASRAKRKAAGAVKVSGEDLEILGLLRLPAGWNEMKEQVAEEMADMSKGKINHALMRLSRAKRIQRTSENDKIWEFPTQETNE